MPSIAADRSRPCQSAANSKSGGESKSAGDTKSGVPIGREPLQSLPAEVSAISPKSLIDPASATGATFPNTRTTRMVIKSVSKKQRREPDTPNYSPNRTAAGFAFALS